MSQPLYADEVLNRPLTVNVSQAMYRALYAKFLVSGLHMIGLGFETWLREYLRGLAYGPGVEEADREDRDEGQ